METVRAVIDIFLHLDTHLGAVIGQYGGWTYGILFVIIFAETGLVVTPFLPGDSLLFAVGTFAAIDPPPLSYLTVMLLLFVAAVLGDAVNYAIGHRIGPKVFRSEGKLLNREHLRRTEEFYERHGGKTIIIARFIPIIRTFAPFVAGVGRMGYGRFFAYNVLGGFLWVTGFVSAGFFFGNIPVVRKNFTLVILAIIFLSVLPGVIEFVRHRRAASRTKPTA
jgi:membrane-associated protein